MSQLPISRYPTPELADLPQDIRERIDAVQEKSGFVPNVFLALARRPDEFRAFFAYHDALMEKPGGSIWRQCVVVGIDSQTIGDAYLVQQFTGDVRRTRNTARSTLEWAREVQDRGAGEIVLNCMASDGVRGGYDIAQLRAVRAICQVPLVASGGAGAPRHFAEVFQSAQVDAALAASVFHSGEIAIPDLRRELRALGIEVRP